MPYIKLGFKATSLLRGGTSRTNMPRDGRFPCPQTYQVANKQPSTFSTTKRPSFWLSKTLSFASIHYDGESGRLDEFVLKFSPKWIRLEAKIQIANFRLALY